MIDIELAQKGQLCEYKVVVVSITPTYTVVSIMMDTERRFTFDNKGMQCINETDIRKTECDYILVKE